MNKKASRAAYIRSRRAKLKAEGGTFTHGHTAYCDRGCRCDVCVGARREWYLRSKQKTDHSTTETSTDLDFYEGSALEHLLRWWFKNDVEDLKKARRFVDILIERAEAK